MKMKNAIYVTSIICVTIGWVIGFVTAIMLWR